jgi:hypothetical protein
VACAAALALVLAGTQAARAATVLHRVQHFDPDRFVLVRDLAGVRVDGGDLPTTWEAGQPELPYDVVTVLVPRGARVVRVGARAQDTVVLADGVDLAPAGAIQDSDGRFASPPPARLAAAAWSDANAPAPRSMAEAGFDAALYPAVLAAPAGGGSLHGYSLASVRIYPLRWDAERRQVVLARTVHLAIEYDLGGALPLERRRYSPAIEARARRTLLRLVANPEALDGYDRRIGRRVEWGAAKAGLEPRGFRPSDAPSLEGSPVEYVIVTSAALAPAWQTLADWKTRRGVPTVVRTTEWIQANYRHGSDLQETIRTFLRDAYLDWGVQYVLLAGDTDVLPARYGFSAYGEPTERDIPTDMYFACLDGTWNLDGDALYGEAVVSVSNPGDSTDLYAEVFVGRAPVSTPAEAGALVGKIMQYENPVVTNHQQQLLLIGEVLSPVNWSPGDPITIDGAAYSEEMLALAGSCTDTIRVYDNYTVYPGSQPLTKSAAIAALNAGPGFVNHIGHGYRYSMSLGDASLTNTDALSLTNVQRRFVLYMLNCTATAFDFPCLGEAFLDSPGGAVAVLGSTRSAYAQPARNYNREFFEALHQNGYAHLGETFVQSRLQYTPNAYFDTSDHYSHFLYNFLGDPEMIVHTCSLATPVVTYADTLGVGPANVAVHVTVDGAPRQGALVCLLKGAGGAEAYEGGETDANGDVTLPFVPESAGVVQVAVSGQNMTPHLGTIAVVPAGGAYVHVQSVTLDDDATGGSAGNADGVLDAGEVLEVDLTAVNDGPAAATGVAGVLRVMSPHAVVTDSTFALGSMVGDGGTAMSLHEVAFEVLPSAPDGAVLPLQLVMTDGFTTWTDTVNRVVHAPNLRLALLDVDDYAPGGNGDGQIQAGETFDLLAWFKNEGTGAADGVLAAISTLDPDLVVLEDSVAVGRIGPQEQASGATRFRLTENLLAENAIDLVTTDSHGRVRSWSITLRGPLQAAVPALSTKSGAGVVIATWTPSTDTDLAGYHVYRALDSGGPWTRITQDATLRTAYYRDSGLAPSTRYYYRVTALDQSGNEGLPSLVANISTNPPQLSGWPIQLGASSSCPAAVGDLTGDGLKEVAAGNDHLYAWTWNGIEVRDDDQDPLTWGVFAVEVKTVTGAVALGEMDGLPGLETFVTSWSDTNRTYAIRGDGSFLPGWPRNPDPLSAVKGYWASGSAVDVDADGLAELFAPARNGNLYAWHADGTPLGAGAAFKTGFGIEVRTSPSFANLDADPELEIVFGAPNGQLHVWNTDGSSFPNFPVAFANVCLSNTAVGDVNHDGVLDVVMLVEGGGGSVNVINTATGAQLPGWPKSLTIKGSPISPSPALADLDGDGFLDVVVANNGGSTTPFLSRVYVYDHLGNVRPGWPKAVGSYNSESSPIVADLSGDGLPDILFGNEGGLLYGWDRSGGDLAGFPITIGDFIRSTPFVDDVDGDGRANLVLSGWDKNVYVWDFPATWNPAAAQWPTLKHDVHRSGTHGFVFDIAAPSPPSTLGSPSHAPSTWSADATIDVAWSGAADASGIGGYSYVWDGSPATLPDAVIDTTQESATSPVLPAGEAHWFHLRTVDTLGHWTATALHLGPFWIDTTPPVNAAGATADRPPGVWSVDPTIGITWTAAADTGAVASGLAGYSFLWDSSPGSAPDATAETESLAATSPPLADGSENWFHLAAVDVAGNVAPAVLHVGPFWIDATGPQVALVAPNGGEQWEAGSVHAIRWAASDATSGLAALELRLSLDGGLTWPTVVGAPPPGDSTFAWTVPMSTGPLVRVRLAATDVAGNTATDASDADFAITTPTDVAAAPPPTRTWLEPPAPNPFNPTTVLRYSLVEPAAVRLVVFDAQGRACRTLVDARQAGPQRYEARWDGRSDGGVLLASGIYFAVLDTPQGRFTHRLVLAK